MATPSSRNNQKSPLFTDGGGERVKVPEVSHETVVSVLFRMVLKSTNSGHADVLFFNVVYSSESSGHRQCSRM